MDFYNIIQSELKTYINTVIMRSLFEGDKYGYQICKEIESRTESQFKIKQPTLYSTLKRLEAQGFIRSYEDESLTHGGKRRYYSLTDLGIETFTKSQNDWEYSRTVMDRLISDKDVDLSSFPPAEMPRRISKPKMKKTAAEGKTEDEIDEAAEITAETESDGADEEMDDIFPGNDGLNINKVFINESVPEKPDDTDYSPLYTRPVQDPSSSYAANSSFSYTDDLVNQVFVESAASSLNINDGGFPSFYEVNPYDSPDLSPADEEKENEEPAAATVSDAVFLPPPEPEPKHDKQAVPRIDIFDNEQKPLSHEEQAQNYIDVEYKNILSRYIHFNVIKADGGDSTAAAVKPRRVAPTFGEGLDDIKVRQHDKRANLQYTKQFYVYINRLGVMKSAILSACMLLEVLAYFLIADVFMNKVVQSEKGYYFAAVVVSCLPAIYSLIAYAINPDRKKRINGTYFENLLVYIFAAGVAVLATYLICGFAFGMNVNNMSEFYVRLGLFIVLALNFILNSVIFSIIHRSKRFAV